MANVGDETRTSSRVTRCRHRFAVWRTCANVDSRPAGRSQISRDSSGGHAYPRCVDPDCWPHSACTGAAQALAIVPPRLKSDPGAEFPEQALREHFNQSVTVDLVLEIDSDGHYAWALLSYTDATAPRLSSSSSTQRDSHRLPSHGSGSLAVFPSGSTGSGSRIERTEAEQTDYPSRLRSPTRVARQA